MKNSLIKKNQPHHVGALLALCKSMEGTGNREVSLRASGDLLRKSVLAWAKTRTATIMNNQNYQAMWVWKSKKNEEFHYAHLLEIAAVSAMAKPLEVGVGDTSQLVEEAVADKAMTTIEGLSFEGCTVRTKGGGLEPGVSTNYNTTFWEHDGC